MSAFLKKASSFGCLILVLLIAIAGAGIYHQMKVLAPDPGEAGVASSIGAVLFDTLDELKAGKSFLDELQKQDKDVQHAAITTSLREGKFSYAAPGTRLLVVSRKGLAGRYCSVQIMPTEDNQAFLTGEFAPKHGEQYWAMAGDVERTDGVKSIFRKDRSKE